MTTAWAKAISRSVVALALGTTVVGSVVAVRTFDRAEPGQIVVVPARLADDVVEAASLLDDHDCSGPAGDPALGDAAAVYCRVVQRKIAGATFLVGANLGGLTFIVAVGLLWLLTGMIIVSRQPRNASGWVLHVVGVALITQLLGAGVVFAGIKAAPGSVPLVGLFALVGEHSFVIVFLLPLLWLYFPDGRPPSERWRWPVRIYIGGVAVALLAAVFNPGPLNNFVEMGIVYLNPLGVSWLADISGALQALGVITALSITVATVFGVRGRYRRAVGDERQQLRWLRLVTTMTVGAAIVMFVGGIVIEGLGAGKTLGWWWPAWFAVAAFSAGVGVPAAYVIAILKHGLWGLDVFIKKTVQYLVVFAAMAIVAVVVVIGVPALVLGTAIDAGFWGVVALAAVLAAAFSWLLGPARRIAARVVYGRRASPYEVLSDFGVQVGGAYSMDDVLPRMAALVADATGARRVDVWLRVGRSLRSEARYPADAPPPPSRPVNAAAVANPTEFVVDVVHEGTTLGAISVEQPPDDPMNPMREGLLRGLAGQAGLVLRNVSLLADVRASRQRLVVAQDDERRRIERNLHDGAQQQLVALSVQLRLVKSLIERDPAKAVEMVDTVSQVAADALEDLRDLARGIYPPVLADQGLGAALEAQAHRAALPTTVSAEGVGRYGPEIEAAIYFCILEALNNVAKYAGATRVAVVVDHHDGQLSFSVTDDGRGFDPDQAGYGTGLQGMADRMEAVGGRFEVVSAVGAGTTVAGRVPAVSRSEDQASVLT